MEVRPFDASVVWTGAKPAQVQTSWITCTPAVDDDVKSAIAAALTIQDLDDYNVGNHTYKLQKLQNSVEVSATTYNLMVSGSYSAELTIEKFTGAPAFTTTDLAFVGGDLVYTGEAQALLAGGATATANGFPVPVVYTTKATPAETDWVALANLKETNANTTGYTVYYKVVGTDNYAGSAVQTMTGTKPIAKATITFNLSAADGLTYNGAPQALLALTDNTKPATNFGASTLQYKIDAAEAWAELPETGIAGITGTSAKNGVAYSINLKVPADENGNWDETVITAPIATTIAKATPTFTYVPTHENGGLPSGLVYDGQSHQLVLQEATAIVDGTEISVPLKYSIRRYRNVTGNYTTRTSKPFDQLVGTLASTRYQIRAYNEETNDLNQVIQELENVVIDKATIPADAYTEPVAKNVRTTGAAQDLVDAATWTGETTYGTFQYSLNGTDWSTDIPKGTDVAEYPVYWRILPTVVSDTRNYNIVSGNKTSIITAKSKVTVTTVANQSFGYGTTPTIQKTVEWEEPGEDDLNEAGLTWKFYAEGDAECTGAEVEKVNGYYPVGTYNVIASGLAVTGATKASQEIVYVPALVKITAGQIVANISSTVTYGSVPTFNLTHVSGLAPDDAEALNANSTMKTVTVKKGEEVLVNGDPATDDVKNALKALDAYDSYTLEATAEYDSNTNYTLLVNPGTLKVNPNAEYAFTIETIADVDYKAAKWEPEVTVTGLAAGTDYTVSYGDDTHDNIKAGEGIVKIAGAGNYAGATGSKTFTINKANLTITADNFTGEKAWTYGTDEPTYTASVDGLKGNDALTIGGTLAGINGTLKVKRTSNETVGMHTGALVAGFYDADDNKIAAPEATNYNLAFNPGNLQVAKGAVVIQLKEAVTATYGDDPATSINAAIKNIANYEYVSGLSELEAANFASFIDVAAATFELTETKPQVGTDYTFEIAGATSTNYGVTINPGTYNVTAADITLYAENQTINWATDPTATPNKEVSAATVIIAKGELKYARTDVADALTDVVASIDIASQNVGDNKISLTAAENANYNIIVNKDADNNDKFGNLAVTGAATLEMTSNYDANDDWFSTIQSYDGKPVTVKLTVNRTQTLASGKKYTWKGEEWNAFILPFDITPKELSEAFGYAIVNVVNPAATSGNNVAFKLQMSGTIEANTPFMLKNYEAVAPGKVITFTKTIKAPANAEVSVDANTTGDIKFIGSYNKKTIDNTNSNLYYYNGEGAWKHLGASSTNKWNIAPFNAYIETPAATVGAREFTFTFEDIDGGTTAIKSISEDATGTNAKGWYDLKGMKMENAPTQKGVYIKDGKKVVIK